MCLYHPFYENFRSYKACNPEEISLFKRSSLMRNKMTSKNKKDFLKDLDFEETLKLLEESLKPTVTVKTGHPRRKGLIYKSFLVDGHNPRIQFSINGRESENLKSCRWLLRYSWIEPRYRNRKPNREGISWPIRFLMETVGYLLSRDEWMPGNRP